MFDIINNNSSIITLFFSFVVAISTVVYSILTASLVKETKIMRKSQTEPEIIVYVEPSQEWINIMNIHIKNIGNGAASNICFKIINDYVDTKGRIFSETDYIKNGIKFLAPQGDYCSLFDNVVGKDFSKKNEMRLDLIVKYENRSNHYTNEYSIDLSQYSGLLRVGSTSIYSIGKSLEKIEKNFDKITRAISSNRICVQTITEKQARKEEKEWMESMQKK